MTQYNALTLGFTAAAVMAAMMLIFAVLRLSSLGDPTPATSSPTHVQSERHSQRP